MFRLDIVKLSDGTNHRIRVFWEESKLPVNLNKKRKVTLSMPDLGKLDHIAIIVDSIEEIRDLYTEKLGFEHKGTHTAEVTGDSYCTLKNADNVIELVEVSEGSPLKKGGIGEVGLNHVAYQVDDLEEFLENAKELNFTPVPETPVVIGNVKFIYLKMPGGEVLEVMEIPEGHEYSYQV